MTTRGGRQCETKTYQVVYETSAAGLFVNSANLLFKNDVDSTVYSSKQASLGLLSGSRRRLYRGPSEWDDCIATIETPRQIILHREGGSDVEIKIEMERSGLFSGKMTFALDDQVFVWEGFSKLLDGTGDPWLDLTKPWFARTKFCDLTVTYDRQETRDALLAMFVARHWEYLQEEEEEDYLRRRRNADYVPSSRR